ncbi:MAG TPA: SDR family NAD(P)-dependent oxidoreductase [Legionellaceae bacterium]|nr:SDR family NAD(P)-dependent oxidoreductase [Legionellaceae bacterium]
MFHHKSPKTYETLELGQSRHSKQVVVIGGSRGIGLGFVEAYLVKGYSVFATHRNNEMWSGLQTLKERFPHTLQLSILEVTDHIAIQSLAEIIKTPIDILILNAGILCATVVNPLADTMDEMRRMMEVNTFAPDHIMRVLFPKLLNPHSCAVYISSTVSNYSNNLSGSYHSYRASKIAGNMIMQNWNAELATQWLTLNDNPIQTLPCAFPISPGVVRTDMGGPQAELSVSTSVNGMISVIESVRKHKRSALYLYNGCVLQQFPEPEAVTVYKNKEQMNVALIGCIR